MTEVEDRARQQLLARVSERLLEGGIHPLEVAVEAADAEQVRRQIEDLLELALRPAALGDIPAAAVHDPLVDFGPRVPLDPPRGPVGADEAGFEADHLMPADDLGERVTRQRDVIRM